MPYNQPHQCPVYSLDRDGKKVDCIITGPSSDGFSAHTLLLMHMKQVHKVSGYAPCHISCEYIPSMYKATVNYPGKWLRSLREKR